MHALELVARGFVDSLAVGASYYAIIILMMITKITIIIIIMIIITFLPR